MSKDAAANAMRIRYTDQHGQTAVRRILPIDAPYLGSAPEHPETQWLLRAIDVEAPVGAGERVFAMARMAVLPPSA
ncbi:hypothetical protein ACR03S_10295 [Limimaricola variabilis]